MALNPIMQKLAEFPLYFEFQIDNESKTLVQNYLNQEDIIKDDSIDLYCIHCKGKSVFKPAEYGQINHRELPSVAFFNHRIPFGALHFNCTRIADHYFGMLIMDFKTHIIKIGQYPSKGDIEIPDFDRFSKVIPSIFLNDVKKAIGLASHGVGAGSFVYLRRVIEFFISDARDRAESDKVLNLDDFKKAKVLDKIEMLKIYLPEFLYKNKEAYSILSKGIHELSEEDCLNAFSFLKNTIELILEERLAEKNKVDKQNQIQKSISNLHSQIKAK